MNDRPLPSEDRELPVENDAAVSTIGRTRDAGSFSMLRQGLRTMDRKWVVLFLLFGVTGALGLPVLWSSQSFDRRAKRWLTIAVLLYTVLLVAIAGISCWFAWKEWNELLR